MNEDGGLYHFLLHFFITGLVFEDVGILYMKVMEVPGLRVAGGDGSKGCFGVVVGGE